MTHFALIITFGEARIERTDDSTEAGGIIYRMLSESEDERLFKR